VRSGAWHCDLSSTPTTTAFPGGFTYSPATSRTLASSSGPAENLKPSLRRGCRQNRRHTRVMESWLTGIFLLRPSQSASRLDDQCVIPCFCSDSGGGVTVTARISHTVCSVSTVTGPPPRRASCRPASPRSAYCRRHLITAGSEHPVRPAISAPVRPPAASRMIRARSTTRAGAPFDRARRSSSARSASGTIRTRTRSGIRHCRAFPRKHKERHASNH
jgi:hypothetical protein